METDLCFRPLKTLSLQSQVQHFPRRNSAAVPDRLTLTWVRGFTTASSSSSCQSASCMLMSLDSKPLLSLFTSVKKGFLSAGSLQADSFRMWIFLCLSQIKYSNTGRSFPHNLLSVLGKTWARDWCQLGSPASSIQGKRQQALPRPVRGRSSVGRMAVANAHVRFDTSRSYDSAVLTDVAQG